LEQQRLLKEEGTTAWYTPKNRVIRGVLGSAVWAGVLAKLSNSLMAIPLFYFQGIVGALLLEVVNYIEHFGLVRKQDPVTGQYEPVDPRKSNHEGTVHFELTIIFNFYFARRSFVSSSLTSFKSRKTLTSK
jgi:alkane 1-monooxygenase